MPEEGRSQRLLQRLMPRGALGLAALVFFMGLAAALSGAVLYAYYESRLENTERDLEDFIEGYTEEFDAARGELQVERDDALSRIDDALAELDQFAAGGETLSSLLETVGPSVWFVETRDDAGAPSVGSAFVVFADGEQSFLLTSFEVVRASTAQPGPGIVLRKGEDQLEGTLVTWDEARDIALVAIPRGGLPAIPFVEDAGGVASGDRIFAVSGLGSDGSSIAQGTVADAAGNGIQHDAGVGAAWRGGPLVDADGRVVAVASRRYSPLGFDPLAVFFAPPIGLACETVIRCPDGEAEAPAG